MSTRHGRFELAVMGGGNMAQAIVRGAVAAGVLRAPDVIVCDPDEGKRALFESWGVRATASHGAALAGLSGRGRVLLAVKPQMFAELAGQMRPHMGSAWLVVSIMAGVSVERIRTTLGGPVNSVVRVMPNLPASVRQGITAIARPSASVEPDDLAFVERLFGAVGQTVAVDEPLMDAFTALAGSGPAYVFLLVEAMVEAGVRAGFARADSERIVRQTLIGAGALLEAEGAAGGKGRDAAALRESVTSKGGTTEAALRVLEARGVAGAVVDAVLAARDRGRELGA